MKLPTPPIGPLDIIAPIIVSGVFIALTSLLKEPTRHQFSALMIAGAGFVYFGGDSTFGKWRSEHSFFGSHIGPLLTIVLSA